MRAMTDEIDTREAARNARRDRDARAADRAGMRAGLAKSFVLRGEIERRRCEGERVGKRKPR